MQREDIIGEADSWQLAAGSASLGWPEMAGAGCRAAAVPAPAAGVLRADLSMLAFVLAPHARTQPSPPPADSLVHSLGVPASRITPAAYYAITYASLAAIYLTAICVQSAYAVRWRMPLHVLLPLVLLLRRWKRCCCWPLTSCCHPRHPFPPPPRTRQVVGVVGSTCGVAMGFLFPAMLALKDPAPPPLYRAFGWALAAMGLLLAGVGLFSS